MLIVGQAQSVLFKYEHFYGLEQQKLLEESSVAPSTSPATFLWQNINPASVQAPHLRLVECVIFHFPTKGVVGTGYGS